MQAGSRVRAAAAATGRAVRRLVGGMGGRCSVFGQGIVEFALILPIFLVVFAATLDLGRVFYAQISLTNAAREGAFQAAKTPGSFQAGQPCNTQTNLVVCRVLLETKDSFVQVQPADVGMSCTPSTCARAVGHTVAVTVRGSFVRRMLAKQAEWQQSDGTAAQPLFDKTLRYGLNALEGRKVTP